MALPQDTGDVDSVRLVCTDTWRILSEAEAMSPPIELSVWTDNDVVGASLGFYIEWDTAGFDPNRWQFYQAIFTQVPTNPPSWVSIYQSEVDSSIYVDTFKFESAFGDAYWNRSLLDTTIDPTATGPGHFNGFLVGVVPIGSDPIFTAGEWTKIGDLQLHINLVDPMITPDSFDLKIKKTYYIPAAPFRLTPPGGTGAYEPYYQTTRIHVVNVPPWDVDEPSADGTLPRNHELAQNYPNPFNPTTNIKFYVKARGYVDLDIYNILGRRVKTLVSGDLSAGWHEVVWDGSDSTGDRVASGVYFYRMSAGEFAETRKMLLLK
jgi:hypothetical protein